MEMTDYYNITVQSADWLVIMSHLLDSKLAKDKGEKMLPEEAAHMHTLENGTAMFHLSKDVFTAEEIARYIGSTPEAVARVKTITLTPFKEMRDWQRPNVEYVGHA